MEKRTIVITGGANGIGYEIASLYAKEKYNVVVIDNDLSALNKIKNKHIYCYYANIANEKQIELIINNINEKFNTIDILVNNAAKQIVSTFENTKYKDWKEVVDINLNGTFLVIKNSLQYMKNHSTILNIISVHHDKPRTNKYSYDATKSAIAMLTKELALELASKDITVNALSFGAVSTNMNSEWLSNSKEVDNVKAKVPLRIIFKPKEIATFAKTVINDFSSYTTGSIFTIDGGRSLT